MGERGLRLTDGTSQWVQGIADRDHDGDFWAAAASVLEAAHASEADPENPWAYLEERVKRGPQIRPPA